jgi:hypothetical protein
MTHSELKLEIQKAIDHVPDTVLEEILGYLKQLQSSSEDKVELSRNLKRILLEDKELLQKLAL